MEGSSQRLPNDLTARLSSGSPLMLVGRSSADPSPQAYRSAVKNLESAVEHLGHRGLDLTEHLPERSQLLRALQQAQPRTTADKEGRSIRSRFAVVDLRPASHTIVFLSAGTASRLDANRIQPFVRELARTVDRYEPVGVWGLRVDRWTRDAWALGPFVLSAREHGTWLGDSHRGWRQPESVESILLFFDATMAEETAKKLPEQTRNGMARETSPAMVDGRAWFGAGLPPPPGFGFARLRDEQGVSRGRGLIYLDDDAHRPASETLTEGGSKIYGPDGSPVDQVANVKWALSTLGRPGWSRTRVGQELVRRQFSHVGYRRQKGRLDAAVAAGPKHLAAICDVILDHLEVYFTGCWTVKLGVEGVEDLEIDNMFPADGPWLTFADYKRLAELKHYREVTPHAKMTLAGLKVTHNGIPAMLVSGGQSGHTWFGQGEYYRFGQLGRDEYASRVIVPGSLPVSHKAIAGSVLDALTDSTDVDLAIVRPAEAEPSADEVQLHEALEQLAREQIELENHQRGLNLRLSETHQGQPVLSGQAARAVNDDYNTVSGNLADVERRMAEAKRQLESIEASAADEADNLQLLLHVAAVLRDPQDRSLTHVIEAAVRELHFESETTTRLGRQLKTVRWRGVMVWGDGEFEAVIPIQGEERTGKALVAEQRVDAFIASMGAGTPFDLADVPQRPLLKGEVAARLAAAADLPLCCAYSTMRCDDPAILRVAMAAVYNQPDTPTDDLADQLSISPMLVDRIREVHRQPRGRVVWRWPSGFKRVATYVEAAMRADGELGRHERTPEVGPVRRYLYMLEHSDYAADWRFTVEAAELLPCAWCGARTRTPMDIPEPVGAVCLECRRDRAGLIWPADPYDRYVGESQRWRSAGQPIREVPAPVIACPGGSITLREQRTSRGPSAFSVEEIEAITDDYRNLDVRLGGAHGLLQRHAIKQQELYAILDAAGVPRRRVLASEYRRTQP
jgi:hypothetical protein